MAETTRAFEQDVGADCSNSCVARYLSIISRVAQSSAVPFREQSRIRAGNYAVDAVDAVFSHTSKYYPLDCAGPGRRVGITIYQYLPDATGLTKTSRDAGTP